VNGKIEWKMMLVDLIIGRNPKNLFATKENLFELVSEKQGEQTRQQLLSRSVFRRMKPAPSGI
jgi:hypothetical protein